MSLFNYQGTTLQPPEMRGHDQLNFAMQAHGKGLQKKHHRMRREKRWAELRKLQSASGMKQE